MNSISKKYLAVGSAALLVAIVVFVSIFFKSFSPASGTLNLEEKAAQGDQVAARQLVEKLPEVSNVEAQKHIVAAIIDDGDLQKCDLANNVVIDSIDYGVVCRNNIAYEEAIRNLDVEACGKLDNNLMSQVDCTTEVLVNKLKKTKDSTVCDSSSFKEANENCRVVAIITEAVKNDDPELCTKLNDAEISQCKEAVLFSRLEKRPENFSCSLLNTDQSINDCEAMKKALKSNSTESNYLCSIIQTVSIRNTCVRFLQES